MIRRLRTLILITGIALSVLIVVAFVVLARWQGAVQVGTLCIYYVAGGSARVELNPFATKPMFVDLPLYAVLLLVAIPTLLVWRFGPKPPKPGHCPCDYDLTGNTSGVCPECGRDAEKVVSTAVRAGSKQP